MYQKIVSTREEGQRLDKYLHKILPEAGNGFLCKMLRKKSITLNDKKADAGDKICSGDVLKIYFSDDTLSKYMNGSNDDNCSKNGNRNSNGNCNSNGNRSNTDNGAGSRLKEECLSYRNCYKKFKDKIDILFEDEDIVAADKPAGILSQKAEKTDVSVNEWLIGYMLESGEMDEDELSLFRPSVCNRLDRNTSGIILCGKTITGEQILSEMLRERTLDKYYLAAVTGRIDKPQEIKGYLSKNHRTNKVVITQTHDNESADSDEIHTYYRPLSYDKGNDATIIEVKLITGKTHQIRAHLSSVGHPLIGDVKYGNEKRNRSFRDRYGIRSQMLHCRRVEFPEDERLKEASKVVILSPVPQKFISVFGNIYEDRY